MRKVQYIVPILITLLISTFYLATSVLASGVGFTPGKLEFNDGAGSLENTLYVINTGKETSNYHVYADDDHADWFNISPDQFSLAPNENLPVQISLTNPDIPIGNHDTNLSIVAFADGIEAKVGTGAKVPVHISITAPIPQLSDETITEQPIDEIKSLSTKESEDSPIRAELWIGLILALIVVTAMIVIFIRRRRNIGVS